MEAPKIFPVGGLLLITCFWTAPKTAGSSSKTSNNCRATNARQLRCGGVCAQIYDCRGSCGQLRYDCALSTKPSFHLLPHSLVWIGHDIRLGVFVQLAVRCGLGAVLLFGAERPVMRLMVPPRERGFPVPAGANRAGGGRPLCTSSTHIGARPRLGGLVLRPAQLHQVHLRLQRHGAAAAVGDLQLHPQAAAIQKGFPSPPDHGEVLAQGNLHHRELVNEIGQLQADRAS